MFLLLAAVALHVTPSQVPQELGDYLMRKDASFAWKLGPRSDGRWDLSMTSQTWRGTVWEHSLVIVEPAELRHKGSAVVIVTGGGVNDADLQLARTAANATGMPVATLFDIPNQPLWGMKEDDLIAHTFSEFLRSEEPDWPLLFPMAKSAIRALDALEAATKN
jgi:PhoPQ-activated pathogenicity-related protein